MTPMQTDPARLLERLRKDAEAQAEAHRLITDARYGEDYMSLTKEQTAAWEAAELIALLASLSAPVEGENRGDEPSSDASVRDCPAADGEWKIAARELIDALADERDHTIALTRLLRHARLYVADALEAHEHSDGRDLLKAIDGRIPVCETCAGRGEIGGWVGQTAESGGYETEPCPDCGPLAAGQPLNGLAQDGSSQKDLLSPRPDVGSGWQPIETAPTDGTKVDLWVHWPAVEGGREEHDERAADAYWRDDVGDWQVGNFYLAQYLAKPTATHWMPRPAAPSSPSEGV